MSTDQPFPRLRLAKAGSPEDLARRLEKEDRAHLMQHEDDLSHVLAPFKVGSVRYLNAVPLTRGLEGEVLFATPSQLAEMLRRNELDAALVSVTEVLLHDRYKVLDGISVSSLGEVKSVFLAHRLPLEEIREILCDTASLTSVNLLKVLLAERGLHPRFSPLPSYDLAAPSEAVLLIGDPAIEFLRNHHSHQIWDLGAAWHELTQLPFVYAVWAIRRDVAHARLSQILHSAQQFGLESLDFIIRDRTDFDYEFRRDYLSWHIHYHLGTAEHAGLNRFMELMQKHGLGPVYPPQFVP